MKVAALWAIGRSVSPPWAMPRTKPIERVNL